MKQKNIREDLGFFTIAPRLGRIKFLGLTSFWLVISVLGILPVVVAFELADHGIKHPLVVVCNFFIIIGLIIMLSSLINVFFLKIRRLNDFNLSGWWLLLVFIPVANLFLLLAIYFAPGTKGQNKFGNQSETPTSKDYFLILSMPIMCFVWGWIIKIISNTITNGHVERIYMFFRS